MDTMSRSAALNPTSTPFFPGALKGGEDVGRNSGLGFSLTARQGQHPNTSSSSLSVSPSDFRSFRSSPSPPQENHDRIVEAGGPLDPLSEGPHHPPATQPPANSEGRSPLPLTREPSMSASIDSASESQDTPASVSTGPAMTHASLYGNIIGRGRDRLNTPPVATIDGGQPRSSFMHAPFVSSSPASSLDSGSHFASSMELSTSFEAQLKASPFIHDILDRLVRCEYTTRELQRDLGEVHRKIDMLLDRSLGVTTPPEFRDPFAATSPPSQGLLHPGLNTSRASISPVAPNQSPPSDDITSISTRLNTLTTSVGQLLALQTQQYHSNSAMRESQILAQSLPQSELNGGSISPPSVISSNSILGMGLPGRPENRPGPRLPNPPMRTWSAGNLELPMRNTDSPNGALRQDFRDNKRRSVSGLLRRDSGAESLSGQSTRDGGPLITKWEQLALAPDLLRSLTAFGVGPPNKIQQRALPFLLRGSDIIAQAPPTQERIAAYAIPAIHIALTNSRPALRGPLVVMISTTVDQATQAQRMIRDLGGPIGVKSALGVGATSVNGDVSQELRLLQQNMPHVLCGTPQKLHALFTSPGGLSGGEVRFLVLDEVDQLIARNLHEYVFNIIKLLPPPRNRAPGTTTPSAVPGPIQPPFFETANANPMFAPLQANGRRFSSIGASPPSDMVNGEVPQQVERQTALFSNTVPQDVLNLAQTIHLREPIRVLVRRDGNVTHADTNQGARGLRQFYLYLAFTASGRSDAPLPPGGLGIIGSGRGASNAETAQAREWKLDALADLFDDLDHVPQAIIHVGGMTSLDAVVYKLASRGLDAVPLHGDMNPAAKMAALNRFRGVSAGLLRQSRTKVLVVYDVQVKTPEVSQIPLIINYDLPKAVEEYAHRVAPAIAPSYSRAGVIVNFVTATGGDVEMLRSIECFYKIKCPEVPMSLRDIV